MRGWRKTGHEPSEEAARRARARSYLRVYIVRGKVAKGPCEACGSERVVPHHDDFDKPLQVRWFCRADRPR